MVQNEVSKNVMVLHFEYTCSIVHFNFSFQRRECIVVVEISSLLQLMHDNTAVMAVVMLEGIGTALRVSMTHSRWRGTQRVLQSRCLTAFCWNVMYTIKIGSNTFLTFPATLFMKYWYIYKVRQNLPKSIENYLRISSFAYFSNLNIQFCKYFCKWFDLHYLDYNTWYEYALWDLWSIITPVRCHIEETPVAWIFRYE